MGLDQYAWAVRANGENVKVSDFDFDCDEDDKVEIAYWRKHANLQGWMENLYLRKCEEAGIVPKVGEEDSWFAGEVIFNCVPLRLTRHDLANLEEAVRGEELPHTTGFFFGESLPEDRADDLAFIKKAHDYLDYGWAVYYYCWW